MNTLWGILPVDKPEGWTSHDVVDRVRKALNTRKVGHAGTLDPLATGVLVICVGKATRLSPYLTAHTKRYTAVIQFGARTDTMDSDGTVIERSDAIPDSLAEIEQILPGFRGDIEQTPPMFSAKKIDGQRLHRLARAGQTVEREATSIRIESLVIRSFDPPDLTLDVVCSKGTYVRVLADDIGQTIGCGAHITALRRTACGPINLDLCKNVEALDTDVHLMDPNEALADMPQVVVTAEMAERFIHGQTLPATGISAPVQPRVPVRVLNETGDLLGIGQMGDMALHPKCVLVGKS